MDSIEQRLDARFTALSTQILHSNRETRDTILATLHGEMATLGGMLRREIMGVRGDTETMGVSLRDEMKALRAITVHRFERLETTLADGQNELRRYMMVLHEDTLSHLALLGESQLALGQQMTKMEANLTAGFETRIRTTELVLHDHARRLIALETPKS